MPLSAAQERPDGEESGSATLTGLEDYTNKYKLRAAMRVCGTA
jgi:hypothetical protein